MSRLHHWNGLPGEENLFPVGCTIDPANAASIYCEKVGPSATGTEPEPSHAVALESVKRLGGNLVIHVSDDRLAPRDVDKFGGVVLHSASGGAFGCAHCGGWIRWRMVIWGYPT
jgi:hypothetical protein